MANYTISNNKISISVNSLGAELTSLKSGNTEMLWLADKTIWPRCAPVLFPIVGKLKNNQITHNQITYNLTQHGFARDKEFVLIWKTENSLEFELTANEETMLVYPFHFSLRIRYELEANGVKIKYSVFNPDKSEMFFSIGAHPGFNCKRVAGENLNDFYLDFGKKKELVAEKLSNGLLNGETSILKLDDGKLQLSTKLFESDALVFKNTQIETVKLCSLKSKMQIVLTCKNWPYFGIWSKKDSDAFVCLEPWYGVADSVTAKGNISEKEGIQSLKANSVFEASFSIAMGA